MKKVFIVCIEAYDDFGAYMGKKIENVYTTLKLAEEKINTLKSFDEERTEQFICYQYSIEESILVGE